MIATDDQPAFWALEQDYPAPTASAAGDAAFSRACAWRNTEPAESGRTNAPTPARARTASGSPARRTRTCRRSSPCSPTPTAPRGRRSLPHATGAPWGEATDDDGTVNHLWHVADPAAIDAVKQALADAELLIADGHHRYETARVYAEEVGGEGPQCYALMCLVALQDPGVTVFPTHRLVRGLGPERQEALAQALRRDFDIAPLGSNARLVPEHGDQVRIGYIDSHLRRPYMLTLKDPAIADAALPDHAEPYRRLDTAVLEALILKGALGMTDEAIDELDGLRYARDFDQALELVQSGEYDGAFFMAPTPIEDVQAVAETGESMPPKSTYFYPKVPTGLVFNSLDR